MHRFVGGLLFDSAGRILLVKRATTDPQMGGLWSLPAGGIENGESSEEALIREFHEETALTIEVGRAVAVIRRPTWQVATYEVTVTDGSLSVEQESDLVEARYFPIEDLPEQTVLEARVPILSWWLASRDSVTAEQHSRAVDGLFSSLFYSYLYNSLEEFSDFDLLPILRWHITRTPWRKFKSSIPFLLSDMGREAGQHAVLAELLFSLWTILDDLSDDRQQRYGTETAHVRFGRARIINGLFGAIESLHKVIRERLGQELAQDILHALMTCRAGQAARLMTRFSDANAYLEASVDRTRFLGVSWRACLRAAGRWPAGDALYKFHCRTARFGQLLNDYFDLRTGTLQDFKQGVYSYYAFRLAVKVDDKQSVDELWSRHDEKNAVDDVRHLLEQHDVTETVRGDAMTMLETLISAARELLVSPDEQDVLIGWLEQSLFNTLPPSQAAELNYKPEFTRFLDSFERLCAKLA